MVRRTRKNKRKNSNKTRRAGGSGAHPTVLPAGATLAQVIAQLNNVITFCCGKAGSSGMSVPVFRAAGAGAGPSSGGVGGIAHGGNKKSRKKRKGGKVNEYFTKMLAAKKANAPSFEYKGNTYKATPGGNAGQLTVYKKA